MHTHQSFIRIFFSVIILLTVKASYAFGSLSADEVRSLFSGNTVEGGYVQGAKQGVMSFYSEPFINYFSNDGEVYSVRGKTNKSGSWRATEKGHLCFHWESKQEKCAPIYKEGDHYKQDMMSRKGKIKWTKTYTTVTSGDTKILQDR